jgi:hypothetical protein
MLRVLLKTDPNLWQVSIIKVSSQTSEELYIDFTYEDLCREK